MNNPTRRQFVKTITATASLSSIPLIGLSKASSISKSKDLKKIKDIVIYKDPRFYCIGPSILRRPDGEIIVAFRRAPERRAFGEKGTGHIDAKSQIVMVRSTDSGNTWSEEPQLIHAHPLGGTQEGNLIQLKDGTIVLTSYAWLPLRVDSLKKMPPKLTTRHENQHNFLGGYVLRSDNGGHTWKGSFDPPPMPHPDAIDAYGNKISMFNRGAMCEGSDGKLYWAARSCADLMSKRHYELHLVSSEDNGETWEYESKIAKENNISFTETSLIETPKGDLVGFVRARRLENLTKDGTENTLQGVPLSDHISVIARSTDGGKSFTWQDAGFFGYPHHALQLPDGRVWLTYGYRKRPFGIRARLLNPECTNISESEEIVLRDDGGTSDLGYPWSVLLPNGQILTVYWINLDNGLRHIAGTIVG